MDRLVVDQGAFEDAIQKFEGSLLPMLENAYLKTDIAVHDLDDVWKGEASQTFKGQFKDAYDNIQKVSQSMETVINKLKQTLTTVQQQEAQIKGLAANAEVGTAFPAQHL